MLTVWYDKRFRAHNPGLQHPESPWRCDAFETVLAQLPPHVTQILECPTVSSKILQAVHDPAYIEKVAALKNGGALDFETILSVGSVEAAERAAGAAEALGGHLMTTPHARGLILVRPPGHHATRSQGLGYCIFNNIAIAAIAALQHQAKRVAIIDWDVHYGNGTAEIFVNDPRVAFFSIHQAELFPTNQGHTKTSFIAGAPKINVALPPGAGDLEFLQALSLHLPTLEKWRPDVILISAGFDAHMNDPMSELTVSTQGFALATHQLLTLANKTATGRVGIVTEGGYDNASLTDSLLTCVNELL